MYVRDFVLVSGHAVARKHSLDPLAVGGGGPEGEDGRRDLLVGPRNQPTRTLA